MIFRVPRWLFSASLGRALDTVKTDSLGRRRLAREYLTIGRDYSSFKCYLSSDFKSGFAVSFDGELVSMFSRSKKFNGVRLSYAAVRAGALRLDCYDENDFLPSIYRYAGFVEVNRVKWDDQYAPETWNGSTPDVVFMEIRR